MRIQALVLALVGLVLAAPLAALADGAACAPCCDRMVSEPCHGTPAPACLSETAGECCRAQPAAPASPVQRPALDAPTLAELPLGDAAAPDSAAPRLRSGPEALARGPSPLRLSVVLQL